MSRSILLASAAITAITATLALSACSSGDAESDSAEASAGAGEFGLIEDGKLVVATEGTYRPFTFHEDGSGDLIGYDVEIVEAVADKIGLEVEFQETQWDAIFTGLESGRFDVIANQVSINPEREEAYLFSTPYTVSPGVVVVADATNDIADVRDLDGKTSAQSLTSNWFEVADDNGANVEAVEGWAQAVALLEQGRVDATVNDKLTFLDYTTERPDAPIKIAAETEDSSLNAFAFSKDKEELVTAFDEALVELQDDGTLAEIGEKYFGTDVSQ